MDDLISRTWLLAEYDKRHKGPPGGARKLIEEAPSALGTNLAEVGTDCITRQAAIDELVKMLGYCFQADEEVLDAVVTTVRELPSAQPKLLQPWEVLVAQAVLPQPKMGKWIYHIDDLFPAESTMECNQCHAEQPLICDDEFCPKCGTKMEGTT